MKLRLGTRGSDLATTQSKWIAGELAKHGIEAELVIISTSGDRSDAPSFGAIGPQGVFVREIENALLANEIDIAVHSFKDLPTQSPAGLAIGAVPPRRDVADWLFYRKNWGQTPFSPDQKNWGQTPLNSGTKKRGLTPISGALTLPLPSGARVGTASARRQAWLKHFRADLEVASLRGNVPTRLKRLVDGDYDAILLAGAGVERLSEASDVLDQSLGVIERLRLNPHQFVPAPAQGALAVQCRADADAIREALALIDDPSTRAAVDLERRTLALAEGGCDSAFGAYAERKAGGFDLSVMVERDGSVYSARPWGDADSRLEHQAMQTLMRAIGGTV